VKRAPGFFSSSGHRGTRGSAPLVLRAGWRAVKVIPPAHTERPATLALLADRDAPGPDLMQRALDACHVRGIPAAISQALRPHDYAPFVSAGGTLVQELSLLILHDPPSRARWIHAGPNEPRRHRADHSIARLDYLAFGGFWHFDTTALADALAATRVSRLRAIVIDDEPVGYIITGYNGDRGFIQRLAVHPAHQGHGYASALLRDSLGWLGRRGATSVTINTQTDNHRARMLYERHGFSIQPERLGVIGWEVSPFMPRSVATAPSLSDSLRSDNPHNAADTPTTPLMPRSVATAPSLSDSLRSDNPHNAADTPTTPLMPRSVATAPSLSDSLRSDNQTNTVEPR
jgi:ribosomal protein S18 acetylase RimI-like enzyme